VRLHPLTILLAIAWVEYVLNLTRRDGDALARALNKRLRPRDASGGTIWLPDGRRGYGLSRNPPSDGAGDRNRTGDVQLGKLAFCR
jgi:hypothetical protein